MCLNDFLVLLLISSALFAIFLSFCPENSVTFFNLYELLKTKIQVYFSKSVLTVISKNMTVVIIEQVSENKLEIYSHFAVQMQLCPLTCSQCG